MLAIPYLMVKPVTRDHSFESWSFLRLWVAGYLIDFTLAKRRVVSRMSEWCFGPDSWWFSPWRVAGRRRTPRNPVALDDPPSLNHP